MLRVGCHLRQAAACFVFVPDFFKDCINLVTWFFQQAVNFLNSMNWNTEGKACFACLALIMNYLLKLPLNSEREGRKIFIAQHI